MHLLRDTYDHLVQMVPIKHMSTTLLPPALRQWLLEGYPKISLDAAGLVALADLTTIARRTALTGTSTILDALVLAPGLHRQQNAPELNKGEYPACAAMTTGYVFRVENQATAMYLQKVGRTAHLTTLKVGPNQHQDDGSFRRVMRMFYDFDGANAYSTTMYALAVLLTITVLLLILFLEDWWALNVLGMLILARALNVIVIRRQSQQGWKGAAEPGVKGDLLILLSQDRWIRMQGQVDDIKAVTSGEWLREPTFLEGSLSAFATLLVYLDAALASNARQESKLLLIVLLLCSAALLGVANECTDVLRMYGRSVGVSTRSERYARRLDLAQQLKKETGREDWAVRLGMLQPEKKKREKDDEIGEEVVTM